MLRDKITDMLNFSMMAYGENFSSDRYSQLLFEDCSETGVQYYIGKNDDSCLIAFRGTDSARDLITDFCFWKKTIPYGNDRSKIRVHSGFIGAYKNTRIREKILRIIGQDTRNIYITGHSYGAALAVLCAVDLQYHDGTRNIEVVVFGCPRVGNAAFADSYNRRVPITMRVENGNDMITKIPFRVLGYKHVKKCLRIGPIRLPLAYSLRDHSLSRYLVNISGNKPMRLDVFLNSKKE